jgi:hypothetical protein
MVPPMAPAPMTMYRITAILSVRAQRPAGRGRRPSRWTGGFTHSADRPLMTEEA